MDLKFDFTLTNLLIYLLPKPNELLAYKSMVFLLKKNPFRQYGKDYKNIFLD